MDLKDIVYGLRDIEYSPDLPMGFVDDINKQSKAFRDEIVSKLGLKQTSMLHGGGIQLEFEDGVFPEEEIIAMDPDHVIKQLGGGLLTKIKAFFMKSSIKAFMKRYEKLKEDTQKKVQAFSVETGTFKKLANDKCEHTYNLMLNSKATVIIDIQRDDQDILAKAPERRELLDQDLAVAQNNKKIFSELVSALDKQVNSKTTVFTLFGIKFGTSTIEKLKKKVKRDFNEFNKLFADYVKYAIEKDKLNRLADTYTKFLSQPEQVENLLPFQKKEFKEFQEKQKLYDALKEVDLQKMQNVNAISKDIGTLMADIADFERAFRKVEGQKVMAVSELDKWEKLIRSTYLQLSQAIKLGKKYKGILDEIKILTEDNYNYLKSIAVEGIEGALTDYNFHNQSVKYAQEMMSKLVNTMVSIFNRFINLEPARNMKEDAFAIGYARTFILSMIKNIEKRQSLFNEKEKYLQNTVKKVFKGGMHFQPSGDVPPYFPHQGTTLCTTSRGKQMDITSGGNYDANIGEIQDMPYGGLFIDNFTGSADSLQSWYTTYINDKLVSATTLVTYLPVYNCDEQEIQIIKFTIDPTHITDRSGSSTLHSTHNASTLEHGEFIEIEDEYYTINIFNTGYENLIQSFAKFGNKVILPLFYNMHEHTDVIKYREMHLINPVTAEPVLCCFAPARSPYHRETYVDQASAFKLDLQLEPVTEPANDLNRLMREYQCYYQFNAPEISYDLQAYTGNIINIGLTPAQAQYDFSTNDDFKLRHYQMMLQLTHMLNGYYFDAANSTAALSSNYRNYSNILNNNTNYGAGFENTEFNILNTSLSSTNPITILNLNLQHYFKQPDRTSKLFKYLMGWFSQPAINDLSRGADTPATFFSLPISATSSGSVATSGAVSTTPITTFLQQPSVSIKTREIMATITRLMEPSHKYWKNLISLKDAIAKFNSLEYTTDFEKNISDIIEKINEMARMEGNVLSIMVDIPKITIAKYSIMVKDMEIKPVETTGPQTEEGKSLMETIVNSQGVVSKFESSMHVTQDSLAREIDPLLKLIAVGGNTNVSSTNWFKMYPDKQKYLDFLRTQTGAMALIDLIQRDPVYQSKITSICTNIKSAVGLSDAYDIYDRYRGNTGTPGQQQKKVNPFLAAALTQMATDASATTTPTTSPI